MGHRQKKGHTKENDNREFAIITYLFLAVFLALMGYFVYFQIKGRERYLRSPENSLRNTFSDFTIRGKILTEDGQVLAESRMDENNVEQRTYPFGNVFCHVTGYTGRGLAGLEQSMNYDLLQSHEPLLEQSEKRLNGEKLTGDSVVTTLNPAMQKAAYDALGDYSGAVIAMEVGSGKILTMVSKPDFDPNQVATEWKNITAEGSTILFNRTVQGAYTPGSVFKIFTTLAYIREHPDSWQDYSYDCTGAIKGGSRWIHCAEEQAHGNEDLQGSFANSCNSSFANIASSLNRNLFQGFCDSMLFNCKLPGSLGGQTSRFSLSETDTEELAMVTGFGQGKTLVSPLHILLTLAMIDNNGICMTPYLVDHIENKYGTAVTEYHPQEYGRMLSEAEASLMQSFLLESSKRGTAGAFADKPYTVSGKTGTAQVSDTDGLENAWFAGYAHADGKRGIAIAVVVENSGYGAKYAVPIAQKVFDSYFQ